MSVLIVENKYKGNNMKIRNGFVSNSSSSSFLIYGTKIEKEQALNFLKDKVSKENLKLFEECPYELSEELSNHIGVDTHFANYEDYIFLGNSWSSIKDDQTGKEFKDNIELKIKEHFPESKFNTIKEAWYN